MANLLSVYREGILVGNTWFFVFGLILCFCIGYIIGVQLHMVRRSLESVQFWIKEREAEDAETQGSAVVESSPNLIRERDRQGQLDTEESQIVTVKSPAQVRADKDRQLQKDIDRETGMRNRS